MNPALPASCDVLVIGAGPAGSACAQWLARAGRQVCLVDQHSFPRDKTCGDGLIPDAHAAFARLGVAAQVQAAAHPVPHVTCVGPRGGRIEVPGRLAVLARRELDQILLEAALAAGARFHAPWRFERLLQADDPPGSPAIGALLQGPQGPQTVRAQRVVLATGAAPQALLAAGLCERRQPSSMALRTYVRHPALAERLRGMEVVWHRALRPGYGWIFPMRDGVFNIGVGLSPGPGRRGARALPELNLREVFQAFTRVHAPARELMASGTALGQPQPLASAGAAVLKGAPLRCSLTGARWSAPGVLVTGEAAGSTYSFTGEGIGKAMETGLMAAEALLLPQDEAAQRAHYEARLATLKPRFDLYEQANRVNTHPWMADLVIWRARRSPWLLRKLAGVLDETANPGQLFSLRGLTKLMLGTG